MLLSSNDVPAEKLTVTESPTSYARRSVIYYGTLSLTGIHEHNDCTNDHSGDSVVLKIYFVEYSNDHCFCSVLCTVKFKLERQVFTFQVLYGN